MKTTFFIVMFLIAAVLTAAVGIQLIKVLSSFDYPIFLAGLLAMVMGATAAVMSAVED
jgi:hypothetical protein